MEQLGSKEELKGTEHSAYSVNFIITILGFVGLTAFYSKQCVEDFHRQFDAVCDIGVCQVFVKECETKVLVPNKQCQAVTRRECPTKYFIRPCGKDDKQICSRVPQEQCKESLWGRCGDESRGPIALYSTFSIICK